RFLFEPLRGSDSSITFSVGLGVPLALHTVDRADGRVASSVVRSDGALGVAALTYSPAGAIGVEATWADTSGRIQQHQILARGDSLVVRRSGERDTTFAVPEQHWAIADFEMQELLAPALLALPRDEAPHPFAVFRPYQGHWDRGSASAVDRAGVVFV